MKAVLIDDEHHVLSELSYYLEQHNVEILGAFSSAESGYQFLFSEQPDAVFLDIDMPGISGIELGHSIYRNFPSISIVYVSAYPQYALESYKVYPVDYILKPIDETRLVQTIDHIRANFVSKEQHKSNLNIKCFGKFEIFSNNKQVKFSTQKAKELLAYFLCHVNQPITRDDVVSNIFNTGDENKDSNNYRVSLYRLRHTLMELNIGKSDLLIKDDCSLQILPGVCDLVDFLQFAKNHTIIDENNVEEAMQIIDTVRDDILTDTDAMWVSEISGDISCQVEDLIWKTAMYYTKINEHLKAEYVLLKLIDTNPLSEIGYTAILDLCVIIKNKSKYIHYYKRYLKMLTEELNCKPERKYSELYEKVI